MYNRTNEYGLVGFGSLCSEAKLEPIAELDTCKTASEHYGKSFGGFETLEIYPKGCYLEKNEHVYFNNHPLGNKISYANPICHRKGE